MAHRAQLLRAMFLLGANSRDATFAVGLAKMDHSARKKRPPRASPFSGTNALLAQASAQHAPPDIVKLRVRLAASALAEADFQAKRKTEQCLSYLPRNASMGTMMASFANSGLSGSEFKTIFRYMTRPAYWGPHQRCGGCGTDERVTKAHMEACVGYDIRALFNEQRWHEAYKAVCVMEAVCLRKRTRKGESPRKDLTVWRRSAQGVPDVH